MTTHSDNDVKLTLESNGIMSYKRLDGQSTPSTYSSIVLSNYSDDEDEENDDQNQLPTVKWKREKFLNNVDSNIERLPNCSDVLNNYVMPSEDNTNASFDDGLRPLPSRRLPPIPADKLHRRNPQIVRQEFTMLEDFVSDADLVDIHLNEMPGLQNTDQWKRIAGRANQSSPPLSRQYYRTVISASDLQDGQVPQPLGSYRRPGRIDPEPIVSNAGTSLCRLPRRRILLGSFIAVVIVAIVVSVVLAITIVQKSVVTTTDYYEGSVYVRARFNELLLNPSSTLAKSYKRELCSLIGTTLADTRTKYAIFYSTCVVTAFHNGSIIADFVLGFTQHQNVTYLNLFLNRTLVNKPLFDGTISSIAFYLNDTNTNSTGGSNDEPVYSTHSEKFIMTEQNSINETSQQPAHTSYTTVTYTTLEKAMSTLGDITTRDSTTTDSTTSLSDGTITDSTSTLANNFILPTTTTTTNPSRISTNRPIPTNRPPVPATTDSSEEKKTRSSRFNSNTVKRQRRSVIPKNQRRLLQYELMPTGKIYYVDRPFYNEKKNFKGDHDDNSSAVLSTILSRSSSVDTLSDKRHRQHQHQHSRKYNPDLSSKKPEPTKLSVGGRLASNNNLTTTTMSSFKPINSMKKSRFSSFEPTDESLDQVFDVLIAAEKRREEHDFWREKFDHRSSSTRIPISNSRTQESTNANTIPFLRSKQTQLTPNSIVNNTESRSQSYTNKRTSLYEAISRQNGCLLEDCLRRRTHIAQQQLPPPPPERNYSPNTIYSTNYPKQQIPFVNKSATIPAQQSARILSIPNGRVGRAPQARQTSDELSSTSDIWAARSTLENDMSHNPKAINRIRTPSAANRSRINQQKILNNKRALSAEQQKSNRTQNKNFSSTTKSKFFDLFKFTR